MGGDVTITFETLYDLLMREKQREELLPLDDEFFQQVVVYLKQKMALLAKSSGDGDLFTIGERERIEAELKSIRRVLRDLYDRREKKIIDMAINQSRTGGTAAGILSDADSLLHEERAFFEEVCTVMDHYRKGVLAQLFKAEIPAVMRRNGDTGSASVAGRQPEAGMGGGDGRSGNAQGLGAAGTGSSGAHPVRPVMMVRFAHPVPKFIGSDLKIYGPFEKEDLASLPKDVGHVLLEKGRVEEIQMPE